MRVTIGRGNNRATYELSPRGTKAQPNVRFEMEAEQLKNYVTRPALFAATHNA